MIPQIFQPSITRTYRCVCNLREKGGHTNGGSWMFCGFCGMRKSILQLNPQGEIVRRNIGG